MAKSVEFCFDVISPASYIAWAVLPRIAARAGAEIRWTPILLGGVMQAVDNRPPGAVKAKGVWMGRDLARWAALYGLDYRRNDVFPQRTIAAMRGVVAYQALPEFDALLAGLFRALHVENRVIEDPAVLAEVAAAAGIDPAAFEARVNDPAIKDKLKANTEDAVARGVFGAPSFFVDGVMHFGQDRLWMVAEDLGTTIHDPV